MPESFRHHQSSAEEHEGFRGLEQIEDVETLRAALETMKADPGQRRTDSLRDIDALLDLQAQGRELLSRLHTDEERDEAARILHEVEGWIATEGAMRQWRRLAGEPSGGRKERRSTPKGTIEPKRKVERPSAIAMRRREQSGETTLERAEALMGRDFLGPDAVREIFGIDVEVIPTIPFSEKELERAKELGQMLVLRVDKAADGQPLTMQKMEALLRDTVQRAGKGKVLYNTDRYKNEHFFTTETPTVGWSLVSKDVLPDSTSKNYVEQTDVLADYLRNKVFRGETVPSEYEAALEEWDVEKADITALVGTNWQEAAQRLEKLQITQLTRQSPADVLYDGLMRLQARSERLLESKYTWTKRRTSRGYLVRAGGAAALGADVSDWRPGDAYDLIGVSFSRSH